MFQPSVSTEQVEDLFKVQGSIDLSSYNTRSYYFSATNSVSGNESSSEMAKPKPFPSQINQKKMTTVTMMKTMKMKGRVYGSRLLPVP